MASFESSYLPELAAAARPTPGAMNRAPTPIRSHRQAQATSVALRSPFDFPQGERRMSPRLTAKLQNPDLAEVAAAARPTPGAMNRAPTPIGSQRDESC